MLQDAVVRTWTQADRDRLGIAGAHLFVLMSRKERFLEVVRRAAMTSSPGLREAATKFLPLAEKRWKGIYPDYEAMMAVLHAMEADPPFWSSISSTVRKRLVEQIVDEPHSLDGFYAFAVHAGRLGVLRRGRDGCLAGGLRCDEQRDGAAPHAGRPH